MRLLVLSDSHGDIYTLKTALDSNSDADAIIFLGDGLCDFEQVAARYSHKKLIAVRGNCDFSYMPYPLRAVEAFNGVKVYCTHGHSEHVKYSIEMLKEAARMQDAVIALFGHTHNPTSVYDDGLYLLNPGSVKQNSCGIVDITPNGIICFTKKIVPSY